MSGIYISGMKMPDRCFACPKYDLVDCCGISRGSYIEYREVDVEVAIDHRPDWCPLVEVPDHGRLIDADELVSDFQRALDKGGEDWLLTPIKIAQRAMRCADLEKIKNAQTVIPAEPKEETV